jgi:hypothetical protein
VTAKLNIYLEHIASTKTAEVSFIRGAIATPIITESNAWLLKQQCYDHKTWTMDNWKCMIWSDELVALHSDPSIRESSHLENTQSRII